MGLESKVWWKESVGEWEHYMQPLTFPGQHGSAFLFSLGFCRAPAPGLQEGVPKAAMLLVGVPCFAGQPVIFF